MTRLISAHHLLRTLSYPVSQLALGFLTDAFLSSFVCYCPAMFYADPCGTYALVTLRSFPTTDGRYAEHCATLPGALYINLPTTMDVQMVLRLHLWQRYERLSAFTARGTPGDLHDTPHIDNGCIPCGR